MIALANRQWTTSRVVRIAMTLLLIMASVALGAAAVGALAYVAYWAMVRVALFLCMAALPIAKLTGATFEQLFPVAMAISFLVVATGSLMTVRLMKRLKNAWTTPPAPSDDE